MEKFKYYFNVIILIMVFAVFVLWIFQNPQMWPFPIGVLLGIPYSFILKRKSSLSREELGGMSVFLGLITTGAIWSLFKVFA